MEPERAEGGPLSVVVGPTSPLVDEIVRSLGDRNRHAVRAEVRSSVAAGRDPHIAGTDEPGEVEACFADACGDRSVDLVVLADVPAVAARRTPLLEMDDRGWDTVCESIVRRTLLVLQAAKRRMGSGGSVVLVLPSISLAGAAGFAAWSAAAESQRVMAKVAARRWGADGIRVNVVSVPVELLGGNQPTTTVAEGDEEAAATPEDHIPSPAAAADLVCMLASNDARSLTGSTVVADGGSLMVP